MSGRPNFADCFGASFCISLERGSVLRILDSKSEEDKKFVADAPCLEAYLSTEASARFDAVLSGLEALGIRYRHNARLVRGLVRLCIYMSCSLLVTFVSLRLVFVGGAYLPVRTIIGVMANANERRTTTVTRCSSLSRTCRPLTMKVKPVVAGSLCSPAGVMTTSPRRWADRPCRASAGLLASIASTCFARQAPCHPTRSR